MVNTANAHQRELWDEHSGPSWVRGERVFDRMLEPHGEAVVAALAPRSGERVLDIGCGFGTTSLHVADAVGPSGQVHGVDISRAMIERAEQRAASTDHVSFAVGDAQTDDMRSEPAYEAVISRFGVMFFDDPVAAFANIRAAVAPGGRMAFVCWQVPSLNPHLTLPGSVLRPRLPDPPPPPDPLAPGPVAFADPDRVRTILGASGWSDVSIDGHTFRMRYDVDGSDGLEVAVEHGMNSELGRLARMQLDAAAFDAARSAMRATFEQHRVDGVLQYDTAVWVVTARARTG